MSRPLPFLPDSFNTVILSDVLEHVSEPARLWSELGRIVAPGGYVLVNVPFLYWLHEEPHDYFRYTSYALRRLAEGSGFSVEHLEPLGGSIEVGVDFIGKHLSLVPLIGRWLARILQTVGIWWSRSSGGASLIRVTGSRFPLSYFMVARKET